MSAVTILTAALQDDSGAGDAVDVSAFSTLRLQWTARSSEPARAPSLRLAIEAAPTAAGPWREIWSGRSDDHEPHRPGPRATLGGFDAFVRATWSSSYVPRSANEAGAQFFTIGLAGDGQPDAA